MGGLWALLGALLWLIPRPLRDLGYDAVGAVRYRVFGRSADLCPIVAPEIGRRLIRD